MEDKRKFVRVKTGIKSEVHFDDGMTFSNSIDMSKGGLFISTPEPLNEGAEVKLSLQIPGEKPVDIIGIVKWIREDESEGNKAGMGIEFVNISDIDAENLKKVLS